MFSPIGEWLPDQPDFHNAGSTVINNVYPRTMQSYGPFPSLKTSFGALDAKVKSAFPVMDTGANVYVFAGTTAKLWEFSSGAIAPTDVSLTTYTTGTTERWNFDLFGNRVLAANFNDAIQTFTLGSSTAFANLASAAPKARYLTVVKDFVMVGNTYDTVNGNQPQMVWWSAINDCTNWPAIGTTAAAQVQSDNQVIPGSQGWIQGLVGNLGTADVAIFFERAIWRGTYVGSPLIFSFSAAEGAKGTPAPGSIAHLGSIVYYLGEDGFYAFDGSNSAPIGAQKVDKYFYSDVNQKYMYNITSAVDPINKLVFWSYPSNNSADGTCDKVIMYNWALQRWSTADISIDALFRGMAFGYTLDGLDALGYSLDTLPYSLDSRAWTGGALILSGFDTNHKMGYFNGTTLAATVETSEIEPGSSQNPMQLGKVTYVRSARPVSDGGTPSVSVGTRNRMIDPPVYGSPVAINWTGECPQRTQGRYIRAKITHPAGDPFSHISGVDITGVEVGNR